MPDTLPCPKCGGSGSIADPRVQGQAMRTAREKAHLSLRDMAICLGISMPYLSDLERGNRAWSADMVGRYKTALKK